MLNQKPLLSSAQLAARTRHFNRCRPQTSTSCEIEAQVVRPLFQAEVRRYFWQHDLKPTMHQSDVCYLELALSPRPAAGVNYLGSNRSDAFVTTGDCSFIPAGQKTVVRLSEGRQLVIGCLFEQEVFAPYMNWQWTPLELAACVNIRNQHLHNALLQLSQELLQPGFKSGEWLDALFHYLLIELSRHIRNARLPMSNAKGKLSPHQLRLIEHLVSNDSEAFPKTAGLAQHLGISSRHLARLFKNTTGQTVSEYVSQARVHRAKTDLLNSRKKIQEIAISCGFKTASAFTQAFRAATGFTPKAFRNNSSPLE